MNQTRIEPVTLNDDEATRDAANANITRDRLIADSIKHIDTLLVERYKNDAIGSEMRSLWAHAYAAGMKDATFRMLKAAREGAAKRAAVAR